MACITVILQACALNARHRSQVMPVPSFRKCMTNHSLNQKILLTEFTTLEEESIIIHHSDLPTAFTAPPLDEQDEQRHGNLYHQATSFTKVQYQQFLPPTHEHSYTINTDAVASPFDRHSPLSELDRRTYAIPPNALLTLVLQFKLLISVSC